MKPVQMVITGSKTSRRPTARGRPAGFTLIELLLVVVIMSVLTGGVVVSLSGRSERPAVRAGAEDLAGAIRFASGEARLGGHSTRVVFADGGRSFAVEARDDTTGGFGPVGGLAGVLRRFPRDVRVAGVVPSNDTARRATIPMEFGTDGVQFAGEVQVEGRDHAVVMVKVWPETGEASVEPPESEPRRPRIGPAGE